MSDSSRSLPPNPSLEQQRRLARELLQAWQAGDPVAINRVRRHLPDKHRIALADAQFVLAREYGFASWSELRARIADISSGPAAASDSAEAFRRAVERRDAAGLRALLARNASARRLIDEPLLSFDAPALVHVAGWGSPENVDALPDFGADPDRRPDWWAGGFHPVHIARGDVAERLLEAGAVPDACAAANLDRIDWLHSLLARGDEREAREFVRRSPGILDELTEDDRRAFPDAAWAGDAAAMSLMLDLGFDPESRGQDGGTLLHCAAWKGNAGCVEIALRHDGVRRILELRDATYNGTALGWCVHGARTMRGSGADHAAVARMLLAAGADPHAAGEDIPPVLRAVFRGRRK